MYWPGSIGSVHGCPGGLIWTAKRSCGPYQISSSFSERSAMPLPTTFHSMSTPSSRAPTRPLECTRPITQPTSPSCSARSWPALPEATQTLRPGRVSARSIQRLTAARVVVGVRRWCRG